VLEIAGLSYSCIPGLSKSFEDHIGYCTTVRGPDTEVDQWGAIGAIAPLKPTKVSLSPQFFTIRNKNICDIRPCCSPLFCHSSVV